MAIEFEKEKKKGGLMVLATVFVLVLVLGGSTYYLFFAPVPFIETITSSEFDAASQISDINLDTSIISDSPVFNILQPHVGLPPRGLFGRENPFLSFTAPALPPQ